MRGHLVTGAEREAGVRQWLLTSLPGADRPDAAADWETRGVTVLPTGTLFSAVRLPADVAAKAAGSTDWAAIDRYLSSALDGPVICTREGGAYVALVPPSAARTWSVSGVVFLGRGSVVAVPAPGLVRDHSPGAYWSVPMESPGVLCLADDVAHVATRGLQWGGDRV
ncbi:hypothetical protein [Streptomyces sp. Y1]|uniref:DNA primase/polymerase bifunctional N-terminal domain-containing protein n=1 Tax=Streptomyces sp. Y1 TaxID=3238634 RepID=A0AB39TWN4_9ACTN